jgi:hypothetical protein
MVRAGTMDITDVDVVRQFETPVRGPDGANRFITIVASARIPLRDKGTETYTCRVGPVFEPHEVLGVSSLPSIAALDLNPAELAECSMQSFNAEYDVDSGQVEVSIELRAAGAVDSISVVFSVTILAAA